jgi:flagellar protein FlgJ
MSSAADLGISRQESELQQAKSLAANKNSSEKEVEKAASGFEALLLHQMMQAMWSTVETTGMMGENGHAGQMYRDMLNQAIADSISEGKGIGVKDFLKKELSKTTPGAS